MIEFRKKAVQLASLMSVFFLCTYSFTDAMYIMAESLSTDGASTIRRTYIEDKKEDKDRLNIELVESLSSPKTIGQKITIDKQSLATQNFNEKGIVVITQKGLELKKDDLEKGWKLDESYNEKDLAITKSETEKRSLSNELDVLSKTVEELPVYGENYHSYRLLPTTELDYSADNVSLTLSFTKVSEVIKGELVAVVDAEHIAYFRAEPSVFKEYSQVNEKPSSTEDVNVVSPSQDPPVSETKENVPDNPESQGSSTVPESEQAVDALVEQRGVICIKLTKSSSEQEEGIEDAENEAIEGATFEVRNVESENLVYTGHTDKDGLLTISNLPLGNYAIIQKSTIDGYEISATKEVVELTVAQSRQNVSISNFPKNPLEGLMLNSILDSSLMPRSARVARSLLDTSLFDNPTVTGNANATTTTTVFGNKTTTITREESNIKYIFKPITISIPGVYQSYSQDGVLKKKEVVVDSNTNTTKIIWEYTTTVGGVNSNITSIRNAFSTTTDSGLGEPKITSIMKDGVAITPNTTYYGNFDNFKSATDNLPVGNGTYVYTIETPVVIPSDNYSLDYRSEVTVDAPKGSKLTYNGTSVTLTQKETRTLSTADTITLPAKNDGGPLGDLKVDTVNTSNTNRIIGKYRDNDDKVIEWTSSQLNDTSTTQSFTFDVALDSSQAAHEYKVYIYEPSNGTYTETKAEKVATPGNQITVDNVPAGAVALVKTVTNVKDEKVNHTISGAQLEALKGDIKIQKNWVNEATPVTTTFKITGGTINQTQTLSADQSAITVNDVPKFSGTGSTATKKRIPYEVKEVVPDGYILTSAIFDLESLTYLFNNKKDESSTIQPDSSGLPTNYGITSVEPIDINYIKYRSGSTVWGGFSGSLKLGFKIPPFAQEGDSFTVEIPEELKLDHPANPNREWTPVYDKNGREIAKVYHTKERELKFVLTKNAYSVSEYSGWYTIGSQPSNIIQKNNDTSFRGPYLIGANPVLPKWYERENLRSTILNKQLTFTGSYSGSSFSYSDKTVTTTGTLNATNNGTRQGDLHQFDGVNKYEYEQGQDYIKWDLIYNAGGNHTSSGRKFWDFIHPQMSLYTYGNTDQSVGKDIEFYVADATAAASYTNPVKMTFKGTSTKNGHTQYHYEVPGTSIGVAVYIKQESTSDLSFDGFTSTHTLEFYYENLQNKALVARIKMRKGSATNGGYYYNAAQKAYFSGTTGSQKIYRRAAETTARGGAYPTDWYSLKLKKVAYENGQKKALEGAVFTIYDANKRPYQTVRSSANGEFTFSELLAGTYTFKETSAPPGYILDPTEHTIVVTDNQNITIDGKKYDVNKPTEVVNTKSTTLQINKFEFGESKPLKGAVFRLQSKNGGNYDVTIGDVLPASQFIFSNLAKGMYTLTETKAPAGYKTIPPLDIEVYEENGELKVRKLTDTSNTQTGAVEVVNGNFSINVVDEDFSTEFTKVNEQGQPLADAVFELRQITQTGYKRVLTGLTSNSQGKLRVDHLQGGITYELWETSAPAGYSKLTTVAARFTVSETGTISFESGTSERIINRPPTYKVKVQKIDALTGQKVTVQTRIGITDSQGNVIDEQISSFDNGEISFSKNFAPGTYYIKEEKTPSGYIGLSGLVPFTIRADGIVEVNSDYLEGIDVTTSSPDTITIKVKNYPLGKFKVSKRVKGISDLTNLITGQMTFTLTKNDDVNFAPIVKQQAANQDFVFENLQPGVYTLTETQAPSGYVKSTENYTIYVNRDGSVRFYSDSDISSHIVSGLHVIKSAEIAMASTYGSSTEDKALDGDLATGVLYQLPRSTLNEGQWWGVNLASPQRVTQIRFAQGKNTTNGSDHDKMDSYALEYSPDGITYQSIGNFTETDLTQTVDIYAQYIRVRNLQTGTNRWLGIRELQVSVRDATQTIEAGRSDAAANVIKIGNIENPEFKIEKVDANNKQISKPVTFKLYKVDDSTTEATVRLLV
ncbi:SpaA isopeptide-forming pilin-related protein [Streptococcus suis]|uniref:SpaA isopeptide-forming pilin-related protein n=1 Tax=Streptococcus suis TaxID=1307 RepID=UPI00299019F7|nr:SpaA isopeptide-forming pilin-related protein [Streptococcus suis]MDW8763697.1 SpaA isopeptide-forming pilin-related protein [Streptococcus suis]